MPAPWIFWDVIILLSQGLECVQRKAAGMIKVWTSSVRSKYQQEKETAEKGIQWRPLATQRINGEKLCFTVQETAALLSNKASRQQMQNKQQEMIFHTMSKIGYKNSRDSVVQCKSVFGFNKWLGRCKKIYPQGTKLRGITL